MKQAVETVNWPKTAYPVVHLQNFIQSIRETGYRNTSSAIAELVDNALQANARTIRIATSPRGRLDDTNAFVAVMDDGCGMDSGTLRSALQFGGSSRFGSRQGLGRFGMGLPSSSLSRARRVTVYTWRLGSPVLKCSLDLDHIASGQLEEVPLPAPSFVPPGFNTDVGASGTLVIWENCDRLDLVRPSTLEHQLDHSLGRIFRHFLLDGRSICVNGRPLRPIDPLFLEKGARFCGARIHGEPLIYDVAVPGTRRNSRIEVRFSELPIEDWHQLPNEDKRRIGIVKGAGVSIVRGGREIDYGWFFISGKRRENYDDWWRCEVRFQPELDELFGVTYTKQGVHPTDFLQSILGTDIEALAHKLNANVRRRFLRVRAASAPTASESAAERYDPYLKPVPQRASGAIDRRKLAGFGMKALLKQYTVVVRELRDPSFFMPLSMDGKVVAVVNQAHPFFQCVYEPLAKRGGEWAEVKAGLDLLLLAAARAEKCATRRAARERKKMRVEWGQTLATFLGK